MPTIRRFGNIARTIRRQTDAAFEAADDEMVRKSDNVVAYLQDVVASWTQPNKPAFGVRIRSSSTEIFYNIVAIRNNTPWMWVDQGTGLDGPNGRRYPIEAKGNYPLRFQTGYSPKTAPLARYNVGDGRKRGDWVSTRKKIWHPGTRARKFTNEAAKDIQVNMRRDVNQAIERSIRKVR